MGIERAQPLQLRGSGYRVAIVAARFNAAIVDRLLEGAVDALVRHGVGRADIEVFRVAGALELPTVVQRIARRRRADGIVALGTVVRGGTAHFEYVSRWVHDGLLRVSLDEALPVTMGVLTCENEAQAEARAGGSHGNKGAEAAEALLESLAVLEQIG